ncbi:TPA: D-alanine--(R)-lactate ligase VanB, partial [Enterococcus faecium]|nr:D-alanine--(R)-lactate ligase VanB [Enterococcus faecium]
MNRIKVAIIFGGCSEEHDVSVKSAIEIAANIDTEKFDPHYIGITKNGVWKLCKKPCTEWEADSLPAILSPDRKTHGLLVMKESEYETRRIDVAFPVLHGKFGEDGAIQGLFVLS